MKRFARPSLSQCQFAGFLPLRSSMRMATKLLTLSGNAWNAWDTVRTWDVSGPRVPDENLNFDEFDHVDVPAWLGELATVVTGFCSAESDEEEPITLEQIQAKTHRQDVQGPVRLSVAPRVRRTATGLSGLAVSSQQESFDRRERFGRNPHGSSSAVMERQQVTNSDVTQRLHDPPVTELNASDQRRASRSRGLSGLSVKLWVPTAEDVLQIVVKASARKVATKRPRSRVAALPLPLVPCHRLGS